MASNNAQTSAPGFGDLLTGPSPPNCTAEPVDFTKGGLKEYSNCYATIIHNLLSSEECNAFLQAAEFTTNGEWELAMVNVGGGRQQLDTDTRNCGRIILDDFVLAKRLQDRIIPHLPAEIITLKEVAHITGKGPAKRKEIWQLSRLNERLRFLKYTSGMYFRPHYDGNYVTPDGKEVSFMTIHLYLNGEDAPTKGSAQVGSGSNKSKDNMPLAGGATRFFSMYGEGYMDVVPRTGSCLVFQHRNLLHSGEDVVMGTKYTVRTDIMYGKS